MRSFKKSAALPVCVFMLMSTLTLTATGDTPKPKVSVKELKQELLKLLVPAEKNDCPGPGHA